MVIVSSSEVRTDSSLAGPNERLKGVSTKDRRRRSPPRDACLRGRHALVALDAPSAAYAWQVASAVDDGATAEDLLGVLRAVAPQVGTARVIAAAPQIMIALGLARIG